VPTWFFALVVVRRGDQFVLVHETKHGQLHYLPGGRAEPGETLAEAAVRETLEEAGIPVVLDGLLRLEHSPSPDSARVRAIFLAHPEDDRPLKRVADEHSQGAAWVDLETLEKYPLRGDEVRDLFEYVARGGPVFPLEVIGHEGAAW
jgi:phosphatase NudJ